jgi:hypothetical protein
MTGGTCGLLVIIGSIEAPTDGSVVSGRLGDDVRPGTWRAILKQTGIKEPEK